MYYSQLVLETGRHLAANKVLVIIKLMAAKSLMRDQISGLGPRRHGCAGVALSVYFVSVCLSGEG